jgi:hypothetical protein
MAKKKPLSAEAFVRKILTETFKQKADAETVRTVAEKVSKVMADSVPDKDAASARKKAA